jgi:hypothetical protein
MIAQTGTISKLVSPRAAGATATGTAREDVVIRRSGPGDGPAISRLARLDDRRLSPGPHILAERGGEIVAAVPLCGGSAIANPFVRTAELVDLLELRARQLTPKAA